MELPPIVKQCLERYVSALRSEFPDLILAVYLHGSIALNDFQLDSSDIDFVTVIQRELSSDEFTRLATIHEALKKDFPDCRLSGSYLRREHLGKLGTTIPPYPFYDDGALTLQENRDINAVTWWLLKTKRVVLFESEPLDIPFAMDWDVFAAETKHNLNTYWRGFTHQPSKILRLLTDDGIQWAVLGVLRLHYALNENDIPAKTQAGEYGLQKLPPPYHQVIQEALNIRLAKSTRLYRFRVMRALDAFRLIGYVIKRGNQVRSAAPR